MYAKDRNGYPKNIQLNLLFISLHSGIDNFVSKVFGGSFLAKKPLLITLNGSNLTPAFRKTTSVVPRLAWFQSR